MPALPRRAEILVSSTQRPDGESGGRRFGIARLGADEIARLSVVRVSSMYGNAHSPCCFVFLLL